MVINKYHLSTKLYHELVAACIITVINNASASGKQVIFSSSIAWYYGDNDFVIRTFNFIAYSVTAHMTCSTDTDSHVTCSKICSFL